MRQILHQDLIALARVLRCYPSRARAKLAVKLVFEAEAGDTFRKRTGVAHPVFGNGTVASRCNFEEQSAEASLDDEAYLDCLVTALQAIVSFRVDHPA